MNYRTMVKGALALSLSLMVGSALASTTTQSDTPAYAETFESLPVDSLISTNNALDMLDNNAPYGWLASEGDESKVISAHGGKALQLNTDAGTLTNRFEKTVRDALNAGIGINTAGTGAYFETEVKFVPSDTLDAGIAGGADATKFAIYAYADENNNTTNLVVFHKYNANNVLGYTNEQFGAVNCEAYTKLRVEMKKTQTRQGLVNVFSVKVNDGAALTSDLAIDGIWFLTAEDAEGDTDNKLVSSLNFKGTGEIDNIEAGVINETTEYVVDWTDSLGVVVSNNNAQLTADQTNFVAGAVLTFYPTEGTITNINGVAQNPGLASWPFTVGNNDTNLVVLAGEVSQPPTGFKEGDEYGSVKLTAAQAAWLNTFDNYDAIDAALKTDASGLEKAYLLNVNPLNGDGTLTVTAITVGADVRVTIALARTEGETAVTGKKINGVLKLYGTDDLADDFEECGSTTIADDDFSDGDTTTAIFTGTTEKFFKAVIEAPAQE